MNNALSALGRWLAISFWLAVLIIALPVAFLTKAIAWLPFWLAEFAKERFDDLTTDDDAVCMDKD